MATTNVQLNAGWSQIVTIGKNFILSSPSDYPIEVAVSDTATARDPQVLMVLNQDASDYCPDGEAPLFTRRYDEYLAFFADGKAQNTGGGWSLPGDRESEVIE